MVSIVIPQAFRIIIPPLTNELVLLLKDSSLVYVLGTTAETIELSKYGRDAVSKTFNGTPITVVAMLYLAVTLPAHPAGGLARATRRSAPMIPAIEVRGLRKSFGDHEVLKGVDLVVEAGEVVCVIGPSGSGKSTLLRCVNRLEEPSGGHDRDRGRGHHRRGLRARRHPPAHRDGVPAVQPLPPPHRPRQPDDRPAPVLRAHHASRPPRRRGAMLASAWA